MKPVPVIRPHLKSIDAPDILKTLPGWLIWRFEHHEGEAKPRKVPYYTDGGKRYGVQGRPEDRAALTTFDAAKAAAARKGFDGIGFAPMPEWGVVALDFDRCVVDGELLPEVEKAILGTYAEYSPSGEGVRAFMRGNLGNGKSTASGRFGFETFSSKGFVTVTGNRLPICDFCDAQNDVLPVNAAVQALCAERFGAAEPKEKIATEPLGLSLETIQEALDAIDPGIEYGDWLKVGMALHHETQGEGLHLWDNWSSLAHNYPGSELLQEKWESFGHNPGALVSARTLVRLANTNGARISVSGPASLDEFTSLDAAPQRFRSIPLSEFVKRKPPGYIIQGVIPKAELIVLFGASGSGKTFIALDLVLAAARGLPWRGKRTLKSRVTYIAAEGAGGLRNRAVAYCEHHGVAFDSLDVHLIADTPNLLLAKDAKDVIASINASGGADLVVVDTFAQVTAGANENSSEINSAIQNCKGVHRATGAAVILIHHSGKDADKGARGWSGLRAAADAELEVTRDNDTRALRVTKMKDDEDIGEFGFRLHPVLIGLNDFGDEITSCIVTESEEVPQTKKHRVGEVQQIVLRTMNDLMPIGGEGVEFTALVAAVTEQLDRGNTQKDRREARAKTSINRLRDDGVLVSNGTKLTVSRK